MIMVPVFYFTTVNSDRTVKNGVALAFTLCLAAVLTIFTNAKRHEVFAAIVASVPLQLNPLFAADLV